MSTIRPFAAGLDRRKRMLLVERDADTRRMYAQFLQLSGAWDIDEADDGREALAKALTRNPHIVVTETRLPGLSGVDLCALLRRDASTSAIPVVMVTGDSLEADVRRAERAGADAVLTKPCLPDRLLLEVKRVLERAENRAFADGADSPSSVTDEPIAGTLDGASKTRRPIMSRSHHRHDTTEPPTSTPALICPSCDLPLRYLRSHVGGVSARHPEQWDYFECTAGCGTFQYRERTRRLRPV
jgi:two-component system, cell cycle response regulator DivK